MKTALGILLAIALVIIFLQNLCKPPVKDAVSKEAYSALEKSKNDTIAELRRVRAKDSIAINEAGQATADQAERTEVVQNALNTAQATINRLRAKVEGAKLEPEDNTWVKVSPQYVAGCDSLTGWVGKLNDIVDDYEEQAAGLNKLMHYEIAIRDSALDNEREFNAKFQSQLNNCMLQLKGKVDKKQPLQLYAGIGMLGNKINPIAGGQVNVSLRARNSQIYEVTGAMVGNTWYGGVGTKFKLSFK